MKQYVNMATKEVVLEDEAEEYVKEKLGIIVEPKGKFGTMTLEQIECRQAIIDWYFSDWIEEEIESELYG